MPVPVTGQNAQRERRGDMVEKLYTALEADGAVSKGIDNFRSYLQTEDNCRQLYDVLKADGAVQSPDFETFKQNLGISYSGDAALSGGHQPAAGVAQQGVNPQAEQTPAAQVQPAAGQTLVSGNAGAGVGAADNVRAAAGAEVGQEQTAWKPGEVMPWQSQMLGKGGNTPYQGATVVADRATGKQIVGIDPMGVEYTQRVENRSTGRGLYFNDDTVSTRAAMEDWKRLDEFVTPEAKLIKEAAMTDDPFKFHETFLEVWKNTDNENFFNELESRGFPMDVQQPKNREQLAADASQWLSDFEKMHKASVDEVNQRWEKRDAYMKEHGITSPNFSLFGQGSSVQVGGRFVQRYNPDTQRVESQYTPVYTNESGREYTDRAIADLDQWRIEYDRWAEHNPIIAQLQEAYAERSRLEKELSKRRAQTASVPNYASTVTGAYVSSDFSDPEYRKLQAAWNKNEALIQTLENSREKEERGYWRALWQGVTDPNTWLFGLQDLSDTAVLLGIKNKIDRGDTLTDTERAVLNNTMRAQQAENRYGGDMGFLFRAGNLTAYALPFIAEFIATGGFSGIANALAAGGERAAAKYVSSAAGKWIMKNLGVLAGDVASAAAMAGTTGLARTASNAMERHIGEVRQDKDGNYIFTGGEDWLTSIYKAAVSQTLEYYTEKLGEHLGLGKWMSEVAGNLGLSRLSKVINYVSNNRWLERGGIQDYPSEVLEEEANLLFNALLVGDNKLSDFVDGRTQADIWGGMLFSIGFMNAPKYAHTGYLTAQYHRYKHKTDASSNAASGLLGDAWLPLRDEIDGVSNEDFGALIHRIVSDDGMTEQQKLAVLKYAGDLEVLRGYNMALLNDYKEQSPGDDNMHDGLGEAEMSYGAGYDASGTDRTDINTRLDIAEDAVRGFASEEDMARLDGSPADALDYIASVEGWSDAQRKAATDYVNAKAAYEGMVQRVRDDIDSEVAANDAQVDSRVHEDGMLHPAVLKEKDGDGKDKQVYIVDGAVGMMPDGSMVDPASSDNSIVVYDVATGERKMIAPSDILTLGEVSDPAIEKEVAASEIRQRAMQASSDEVNGVLAFEDGDVYEGLLDDDGRVHRVEVLQEVPDTDGALVYALFDGESVPRIVEKETLQAWRDNVAEVGVAGAGVSQGDVQTQSARRVAGAPADYTDGMELTIQDEDGTEKPAMVKGRVRYENGSFVPDANGSIIEYLMDGEVKHDHEDKLTEKVVSHVPARQPEAGTEAPKEEGALLDREERPHSVGASASGTQRGNASENAEVSEKSEDAGGDDIQPVGKSILGNLFDQFRGRAKDAVNFLLKRKEGNAVGALHHKDVGDIDLWYGNEQAGLLKIAEKHPEVLDDLQTIIDGMHVVQASENRVILESDTHKAVVSKMLGNEKTDNWLLTAYEKKGTSASSSDIETEPEGKQNGTAPLQNSLSAGKDSASLSDGQGNYAENASNGENGAGVGAAMPMTGEGEDAEPDFLATTPERGHRWLYDESGLPREQVDEFVDNNVAAATKKLDKAKERKPKKGITSFAKLKRENESIAQELEKAQRAYDYWNGVKAEEEKRRAAELAEQAERDRLAHEEAVAAEQARQEEVLAKREEQEGRGANAVHPAIRDKWEAAPKIVGAENELTLANGERVKGRYVLVESGAATPSHNPNAEFMPNEGFPVDENGQTVNDRDYERDRDAQEVTRRTAQVYDSRALQEVPVVSEDGVVLSGNGRTMAGELAARENTDGAYIDYLMKYPQQFGFTAEQVQEMEHPRVLFVPDEAMPYTTETFAKFNQQGMKSQSRTDDIRYQKSRRSRETGDSAAVNARFNAELDSLTEENADRVALSLGVPSPVLISAGVENKPMKLYGNKVVSKMRKHGFSLDELKDLPQAVADPIAVFDNYQRDGNRSVLTELKTSQGNFLVTIDLGKDGDIDFNIVSSVFGKGDGNIVDWFNRGFATYINKEKARAFLSHQSALIAATAAKAELNSAAKVIEDFENPSVSGEKSSDLTEMRSVAEQLGERLHTPLRIVEDVQEIVHPDAEVQARMRGARGWFNPATGEVVVVLPNARKSMNRLIACTLPVKSLSKTESCRSIILNMKLWLTMPAIASGR